MTSKNQNCCVKITKHAKNWCKIRNCKKVLDFVSASFIKINSACLLYQYVRIYAQLRLYCLLMYLERHILVI